MITICDGKDTKTFNDFNMLIESGHIEPLVASFSSQTSKIPKRPGVLKFGQEIDTKVFSLPIFIHGSDWSERQQYFNELMSFLFDDQGKSKELQMIIDYEKDKFYKIECTGVKEPTRKQHFARFELQFEAYDPFKYSVAQNDEITWGSTVITFENRTYTFGHENASAEFPVTTSNNTVAINVIGLALKPVILLEGSATNLVIENQGNKIHVGTFTNSTWRIETDKYIAYQNGKEKIIRIDKNWMLNNGENKVKFTGSNLNLKVTIRFRDRWQ